MEGALEDMERVPHARGCHDWRICQGDYSVQIQNEMEFTPSEVDAMEAIPPPTHIQLWQILQRSLV